MNLTGTSKSCSSVSINNDPFNITRVFRIENLDRVLMHSRSLKHVDLLDREGHIRMRIAKPNRLSVAKIRRHSDNHPRADAVGVRDTLRLHFIEKSLAPGGVYDLSPVHGAESLWQVGNVDGGNGLEVA